MDLPHDTDLMAMVFGVPHLGQLWTEYVSDGSGPSTFIVLSILVTIHIHAALRHT